PPICQWREEFSFFVPHRRLSERQEQHLTNHHWSARVQQKATVQLRGVEIEKARRSVHAHSKARGSRFPADSSMRRVGRGQAPLLQSESAFDRSPAERRSNLCQKATGWASRGPRDLPVHIVEIDRARLSVQVRDAAQRRSLVEIVAQVPA